MRIGFLASCRKGDLRRTRCLPTVGAPEAFLAFGVENTARQSKPMFYSRGVLWPWRRTNLSFCCRFRKRTPGPPPFSSMNSTPADSSAFCSATTVDLCAAIRLLCMRFSHAIRDRKAVAGYAGITDLRSDSDRLARHPSPRGLRPLAFAQAYAGAAAVPVDEFNAGRFQSATYCQIIRCCHRSLVVSEFGAADSSNSHRGFRARSFAVHRRRARAARIWALVRGKDLILTFCAYVVSLIP